MPTSAPGCPAGRTSSSGPGRLRDRRRRPPLSRRRRVDRRFTEVLLDRGAAEVVAVDVGYGQLAWSLRSDSRVRVIRRTNVREVTPRRSGAGRPGRCGPLVHFAEHGAARTAGVRRSRADIVPMVKPQFEVGKGQVGTGGVVSDPQLRCPQRCSPSRIGRRNSAGEPPG